MLAASLSCARRVVSTQAPCVDQPTPRKRPLQSTTARRQQLRTLARSAPPSNDDQSRITSRPTSAASVTAHLLIVAELARAAHLPARADDTAPLEAAAEALQAAQLQPQVPSNNGTPLDAVRETLSDVVQAVTGQQQQQQQSPPGAGGAPQDAFTTQLEGLLRATQPQQSSDAGASSPLDALGAKLGDALQAVQLPGRADGAAAPLEAAGVDLSAALRGGQRADQSQLTAAPAVADAASPLEALGSKMSEIAQASQPRQLPESADAASPLEALGSKLSEIAQASQPQQPANADAASPLEALGSKLGDALQSVQPQQPANADASSPLTSLGSKLSSVLQATQPRQQASVNFASPLDAVGSKMSEIAQASQPRQLPESAAAASPLEGVSARLGEAAEAVRSLQLEPHFGTQAAQTALDTVGAWVSGLFGPLPQVSAPSWDLGSNVISATSDLRETLSAYGGGLRSGLPPLDAASNGLLALFERLPPGPGGASALDPSTLAYVTAAMLLLVAVSTPDDDADPMHSRGIDEADIKALATYSPEINEAYWRRRPVRVAQQVALLVAEIARLGATYVADSVSDSHAQNTAQRAKDVRKAIERLGPAYIKFAQVLSTRVDLVPEEYVTEIVKLQDDVPPFDTADAYAAMTRAWGLPPSIVCDVLDPVPVAAASIGQVYRATLGKRYGGGEAAVKVLRPGILEAVALDVYIMRFFAIVAGRASKTDLQKSLEWVEVIDDWAASFFAEVNFQNELRNMDEFREAMKDVQGITVPKSYPELSSSDVLVTSWVTGQKLEAVASVTSRQRCTALLDAYLMQLLETRFLQSDPHPGNLILTPDGKICILDYGLMARVTPAQRDVLVDFLAHLACEDWELVVSDLQALGFIPAGVDPIRAGLLAPISRVFSRITARPTAGVRRVNIDMIMSDLAQLASAYPFRIPPFFVLILRTFSVIEGIGLRCDPTFSIVEECFPYVARRVLTDDSPRAQALLRQVLLGDKERLDITRLERVTSALLRSADPRRPPSPPSPDLAASSSSTATTTPTPAPAARSTTVATTRIEEAPSTADAGTVVYEPQLPGRSGGVPAPSAAPVWNLDAIPDVVLSGGGVDLGGIAYSALTGQPSRPLLDDSSRELLLLVFRKHATFVQELLAREAVAAADALTRQSLERVVVGVMNATTQNPALLVIESLLPFRSVWGPFLAPTSVLARLEPLVALDDADREALAFVEFVGKYFESVRASIPYKREESLLQLPLDPTVPLTTVKLASEVAPLLPQIWPGLRHLGESAASQAAGLVANRLGRTFEVLLLPDSVVLKQPSDEPNAARRRPA